MIDVLWAGSVLCMLAAVVFSGRERYRYAGYIFLACFLLPEIIFAQSAGDISALDRFKGAVEYLILSAILFGVSALAAMYLCKMHLTRYILASAMGILLCLLFSLIAYTEYVLSITNGYLIYFPYYEHIVIVYCLLNSYSIYFGGTGGRRTSTRSSPIRDWLPFGGNGRDIRPC